jgi:hypothetical protein
VDSTKTTAHPPSLGENMTRWQSKLPPWFSLKFADSLFKWCSKLYWKFKKQIFFQMRNDCRRSEQYILEISTLLTSFWQWWNSSARVLLKLTPGSNSKGRSRFESKSAKYLQVRSNIVLFAFVTKKLTDSIWRCFHCQVLTCQNNFLQALEYVLHNYEVM